MIRLSNVIIPLLAGCCYFTFCSTSEDPTPPDIDLPGNSWSRSLNNPIISSFDTITNIGDPSVIFAEGLYRMWTVCVGPNVGYASICYSESTDGENWSIPEVVFTPSNDVVAWDNQKTEIPSVLFDDQETDPNKKYKMWYGGSSRSTPLLTKVGYAYSADGKQWQRLEGSLSIDQQAGLVLVPGFEVGDAAVISDPVVVRKDGIFHIWYNSFGANNDILISHATSADGYTWAKDARNPVILPDAAWEDQGPGDIEEDVSHPSVLLDEISGYFFMWYGSFNATSMETYDGLGFAYSIDGTSWTKLESNPIFIPDASSGENLGVTTGPWVLVHNNAYHLYYGGVDENGLRVINHATSQ